MDVGDTAEDCLFLNVTTPAVDAGRRPVLVWIHGGGFVIGSGSQAIYDAAPLARRGDAVVVTINYRLGPLGFLHLADLCPDIVGATGNAGIRDQVAALEWVRDNIAAFGGDPGNVTIFGESAGGMSVGTLLGTPAAKGLFHRAIAQSGAAHNCHTRETATGVAERFLASLGIAPADAAQKLRDVPAKQLLDTQNQTMFSLAGELGLLPFQPLVDGEEIPAPPIDAIAGGLSAGVSLMTGTTRDEWKLFGMIDAEARGLDDAKLVAKVAKRIPHADAAALVETYRIARDGRAPTDAQSLYFAIETDLVFRVPAIRLAESQRAHADNVFVYQFTWESPMLGGVLGACHAIELPFVFGGLDLPGLDQFVGTGPGVQALSECMMDTWLAFARTGDPSHSGLDPWPAYDDRRRQTMILGEKCRVADAPDDVERASWDGIL
jgi:para-nitrobenzyl esterase